MTPQWIDPSRFRRVLLRAIALPLLLMAGLAVGLVYQVEYLIRVNQEFGRRPPLAAAAHDAAHLPTQKAEEASHAVLLASVGLTLLLGAVLAVIGRRQLLEVARSYGNAIAQSEQNAAALGASERRLQAIIDGARDAMLICDDAGTVVDANPAALALCGRSRDALLGTRLFDVAEDPAATERQVAASFASDGSRGELRLKRPDGTLRLAEYNATRDFLPGRHLWVVRDISERKGQEAQIRQLNDTLERRVKERTAQLEAANRELESFSYSVSHDLRSPLRHINGFSELLKKSAGGAISGQGSHYLETISESAKKAETLVNELLAFSRMGRAELRHGEVDLARMVAELRKELERELSGRTLKWRVGPLPKVKGDGAMLQLVIRNLLSNAVKYTRRNPEAEISIDCAEVDGEHVITVRDNGVGFDMAYANRLFGVFKRLHSEEEFEGTGIGLANVRRIVERHGGRTWAEGRPDQGATFSFSLPVAPPREERRRA